MEAIQNTDLEEVEASLFFLPLHPPRPFSSLVRVEFGALSHIGKVRQKNEDAFLVYRMSRLWEKVITNLLKQEIPDRHEEDAYAMGVADGMGGAEGGEVASSVALRVLVNLVLNARQWIVKLDNPETRDAEIQLAKERAERYFRKIDQTLLQYAEAYPRLKGMGTTFTGVYTFADDAFVSHIGDSRAYLFRDGKVEQLTRDHTLVQLLVDSGTVSPKDAAKHQFRHMLSSVLGGQEQKITFDIHHFQLRDQDRILLCTNGLTDLVPDADIAATLAAEKDQQKACEKLIDLALDKGGKDNVTVVLGHYSLPK